MRPISRRSTGGERQLSAVRPTGSSGITSGRSKLRCNIHSHQMFVEAEDGDVAVALGVAVVGGNGREPIHQVFDARVRREDVILAKLAEEAVVLVPAGERYDDVASQFVIEAELERVREYAGGTGV